MQESDCVKIVRLLRKDRPFNGTKQVKSSPKVGDIGTIAHPINDFCIVENVDSSGCTIWLADFLVEELEIYEH